MKRIALSILAASSLMLALVGGAVAGQPEDLLCPDGWVTKVESVEDGDINDVVVPAGTVICVKAATENSGKITADGEKTLIEYVTWLNNGGQTPDVSHYVIYEEPTVDPRDGEESPTPVPPTPVPPTPTPEPTCAPDDADCGTIPTPTPKPTPKPTPPPTSTAGETGGPGSGLALALLVLAGVAGSSLLLVRKRA